MSETTKDFHTHWSNPHWSNRAALRERDRPFRLHFCLHLHLRLPPPLPSPALPTSPPPVSTYSALPTGPSHPSLAFQTLLANTFLLVLPMNQPAYPQGQEGDSSSAPNGREIGNPEQTERL